MQLNVFFVILFRTTININIVSNVSYYTVSIGRKKSHLIQTNTVQTTQMKCAISRLFVHVVQCTCMYSLGRQTILDICRANVRFGWKKQSSHTRVHKRSGTCGTVRALFVQLFYSVLNANARLNDST